MKIILFSDIHANLPALEAFFAHVEKQAPDMMYCLGDLVGYNIWPNEVIAEIRNRKIPVIAGNYDYGVGLNSNDCGCAYKTDKDREMGAVSIAFTNDIIGKEERHFLRWLPLQIRIQLQLKEGPANLLLVHGSPRKINEYLFEDRDETSMLRIMQEADADILCFGHTHKPFHRVFKRERPRYGHAINTGAIGKPKDGNPKGCYVLLSIDENSSLAEPGGIKVEFARFDYAVEKAAAAIENSVLPGIYADMLGKVSKTHGMVFVVVIRYYGYEPYQVEFETIAGFIPAGEQEFLKTLDYQSGSNHQELKEQMLNEIRENLKELMHLIELKERQEEGNQN